MIRYLQLFWIAAVEWWNDNTFRMAAALAFYTVFSLAPLLVIAIGVAGWFFGPAEAREQVISELEVLIGEQGGTAMREVSARMLIEGSDTWTLTVGVMTLFIGSTVVFSELQSSLNQVWDVEAHPKRNAFWGLIRGRLMSFALVLGTAFLLLVSLLASAALSATREYMTRWMPEVAVLWRLSDIGLSFLLVTVLFAMIFKFLPDVRINWRDVGVGAVLTSLLFNVGKGGIGYYLGHTATASSYGAAGSFVVFLIWVYYSALICLYGAEFTQVYARRFGSHIRPQSHAVRIGKKADTI